MTTQQHQNQEVKYSLVAGVEPEELDARDDQNVQDAFSCQIQMRAMDVEARAEKIDVGGKGGGGTRKFLFIAASVVNLAAFTCGTSFGWTSPVLPKLNGKIQPENNPLGSPITGEQESWLGSVLPLGAALGPIVAGMFLDKIGRKKTLLAATAPFIAAFLMAAFATGVNVLFVMRFLCGLAVGGVFTALPLYVGEIAEDEVRGALGSFMQLFITFGLLFSYAIGPYVSVTSYNIFCIVAPAVFLPIFLLYIPESPYYLIAQNRREDAEVALAKLRGKSKEAVLDELDEIKNAVDESSANKATFFDIFKSRGLTKALIISVGLVAMQQFSGINVILFYTQTIFAAASGEGKESMAPEIATIIVGIVQVLSSFITPAVVDRMGKRFLLLFSALGMAFSEAVLGYYFYLQDQHADLESVSWLPVACLVIYNITYCVGFGPLPWAVMGELFPGNIKSAASTATASGCWVLAFIITKFFSNVAALIGIAWSFWIFAACCIFAAAFVQFYVPETSGKSLQEVQDILNGKTTEKK